MLQRDIKLPEDAGEAGTQGQAKGRQRYAASTTFASSNGGKFSNISFDCIEFLLMLHVLMCRVS